ncbi:MAG: phosphate transport system regulatory protein PhoU [Spirochaetes bacterium]|nr:MAG: phosphate transport system regulatory protein PhoU [Spirochaetota bacterium]
MSVYNESQAMENQESIEKKFKTLSRKIKNMGELSIEMVKLITAAFSMKNPENMDRINLLEDRVNRNQILIDEECIQMLSGELPSQIDLRFVIAILKTTAELERIGDQVINIKDHFSRIKLSGLTDKTATNDLKRMGEETIRMIESSNRALLERNEQEAEWVLSHDDVIDDMKRQFYTYATSMMMASPPNIRAYLDIIIMASNFERIADLATNIAENAIYFIKGKDIRHSREE